MKGNDKLTVIVALIGGLCALLAAVIGLFNPVVTRLAERMLADPTVTAAPTATALPTATATLLPRATPTATALSTGTPTRLPTLFVPQGNGIKFILANNDTEQRTFFIDSQFATEIDSGAVLVFDAPRGTHQLESCPADMNPIAHLDECDSQRFDLNEDPFDWTIGSGATPTGAVTLVLMNVASTPTDVYFDGGLARALEPNTFYMLETPPGKHTFQNCPGGVTPDETDSTCADLIEQELAAPVEFWKVGD